MSTGRIYPPFIWSLVGALFLSEISAQLGEDPGPAPADLSGIQRGEHVRYPPYQGLREVVF